MSDAVYKIENKPMQPRHRIERKYPLAELKVGQSFLVDVDEVLPLKAACYYYGRLWGEKFSVLREGNGYRCGRIL